MSNAFEEKQEARRERYKELADKARAEASQADQAGRRISDLIPMGQPILVGHHSEKRHRRDLKRIDRAMQAQIDAHDKAEHYEAKARGVGRGGISSDDPDAVAKLREKLASLEAERDAFKEANRALAAANRRAKKANGGEDIHGAEAWREIIGALEIPAEMRGLLLRGLAMYSCPRYQTVKFTYEITNLGGNIRATQKRIEQLEAEAKRAEEAPAAVVEGEGWTLEECPDDNRIRFIFDGKPDAETRKMLKANGFRWAPSAGAWQRHLANGRYAAECVVRKLREG